MKLVDDKIISQTSQLPIVVILSLLALPLHQPPSLHGLSQMSIYGVSVSSVNASQLPDPPPVATPASNTRNTLPTRFINFQMLHFLTDYFLSPCRVLASSFTMITRGN